MPLKPGPITRITVDGLDLVVTSATISEEATSPRPPACDWDTLRDAYDRVATETFTGGAPAGPHVIDQDGNPVRPPSGQLRDLGTC